MQGVIRGTGIVGRLLRVSMTIVALQFVQMTTAVKASEAMSCPACEQCHPEWSCLYCGVITLNAISGCCGMGNGTAVCYEALNGYAVACEGGGACTCDDMGENCEPLIEG